MLEFLSQYRDTEADRRFIIRELQKAAEPELGISELPEGIRQRVVNVSHYLDHLGVLVDRELVDATVVYGFMGPSVVRLWSILSPYIEAEAERRREAEYQDYFRRLAIKMNAIQAERSPAQP
jgi:hypothetical protein